VKKNRGAGESRGGRITGRNKTEPLVGNGSLRADFSAILGSSRYFYD
jgi:hypothetical protein